nr:Chain C, Protein E6 [human papillomavirus 35]7P71_C Chain C, Protein E6 [human papillomavirus 35]7P71_D Chain D, Protein E6 [human papillomavirus 35]
TDDSKPTRRETEV